MDPGSEALVDIPDLSGVAKLVVQEVRDYAIFVLDREGTILSWNTGAQLITGYGPDEIRGHNFAILYPPEDRATKPPFELKMAALEGRFEDESWRMRKDGTRFWGNEIITALHDSGKLSGFIKITRDLSRRKRWEDELRDSEERYRRVVEGVKDYAIVSLAPDRRVTNWNKAAERIIGYSEAEIVGRPGDIIFTPEDRERGAPEREAEKAARDGRAEDERWHVRKNGSRFWASGVMTALRDEGGHVTGLFKVLRDETERKRLEEERSRLLAQEQSAREAAEEATQLKDEFLAVVSHELRTPLAAILLWSKLLRSGMLEPTARDEALEIIDQSAKSQHALIEDLLDVSRIMSGKLRLNIRPSDLTSIIEAAIEAVRPMANAKSIGIHPSLKPSEGPVPVDADRIQQVVWNLLTNAVKFTQTGGRIEVSMECAGREAAILVSDTGQGISAEFLPHVFDRFRQADASTTRLESGLGLGLAITKQLVELHGGTITAESKGTSRGATFTVRLPFGDISGQPEYSGPAHAKSEGLRRSTRLKDLRLMLVEDDEPTRGAVTRVLEMAGARVIALASADAALRALGDGEQPRPDVLISDIAMPGRDGRELVRQLRQLERLRHLSVLPAVALTAYGREQDRQQILAEGFQEYIRKPVDADELVAVVERLGRENER